MSIPFAKRWRAAAIIAGALALSGCVTDGYSRGYGSVSVGTGWYGYPGYYDYPGYYYPGYYGYGSRYYRYDDGRPRQWQGRPPGGWWRDHGDHGDHGDRGDHGGRADSTDKWKAWRGHGGDWSKLPDRGRPETNR